MINSLHEAKCQIQLYNPCRIEVQLIEQENSASNPSMDKQNKVKNFIPKNEKSSQENYITIYLVQIRNTIYTLFE